MDTAFDQFDDHDPTCRIQAALLMQRALGLLDRAGETRAATHLQHAIDTLEMPLPNVAQLQ